MIETIAPSTAVPKPPRAWSDTPIIAIDTPVIFEDEGQEEMGDSAPHSTATEILHCGIGCIWKISLFTKSIKPESALPSGQCGSLHVSPDVMVVEPYQRLPKEIGSYRIGEKGPAPMLAVEVLSPRTASAERFDH